MVTTSELALFIITAIVGYGFCLILVVRVFIVARSFQTGVPFVTSSQKWIELSYKYLEIQSGDHVADLGSGNGLFIHHAAHKYPKAKFVGFELSKLLVLWSRFIAKVRRLKNVKFIEGDLLDQDLSDFDKVYLYMTTDFLEKLMPILETQLPDGAIVVSASFRFGAKFEKSHKVESYDAGDGNHKVYVWRKT